VFKNKKADMMDIIAILIVVLIIGGIIYSSTIKLNDSIVVDSAVAKDLASISTVIAGMPKQLDVHFSPNIVSEDRCIYVDSNVVSAFKCNKEAKSTYYKYYFLYSTKLFFEPMNDKIPSQSLVLDKISNTLFFTDGTANLLTKTSISELLKSEYLFVSVENPNLNEITLNYEAYVEEDKKVSNKNLAKIWINFKISSEDKTKIYYSSQNSELLEGVSVKLNALLVNLNKEVPESFSTYPSPFICEYCEPNEIVVELEKKYSFANTETTEMKKILGSSIHTILE
jgi:hypothetical protein